MMNHNLDVKRMKKRERYRDYGRCKKKQMIDKPN